MLRGSVTAAGEFDAAGRSGQRKAIYLAPTKALLHEKIRLWNESFANPLGLKFKVRARGLHSTAGSVAYLCAWEAGTDGVRWGVLGRSSLETLTTWKTASTTSTR